MGRVQLHEHAGSGSEDAVLRLIREEGPLPAPGDAAWDSCARQLVAEGLAGTALTLLDRSGHKSDLPASARETLERELARVRVSQALLFHRFEALAGELRTAGVEVIAHKGGALAPLLYPRIEDRPMVDIDVIFRPREWRRVRDTVVSRGYRLPAGAHEEFWLENYFNLCVVSPQTPPTSFDLHWSLTQEGRYRIETEDLFARAVPYDFGDARLLRLSNEDMLLSLFLHLAYHYFEAHLIWLYDMKLVIERWEIDWEVLLIRAREWGLMTVVAFNFAFLEKIFPGLVPAGVADRARPAALRRLLARPLLSGSPRHLFRGEDVRFNQFVLGLLAIDRPADAGRFAADKVGRSLRWLGRRPRRR